MTKRTGALASLVLTGGLVLGACGGAPDPCADVQRATPGEISSANAGREIEAEGRNGVDCVLSKSGRWVEEREN